MKKAFLVLLLFLLVFAVLSCSDVNSNTNVHPLKNNTATEIVVFIATRDNYYEFIKNGSPDYLKSCSNNVFKIRESVSDKTVIEKIPVPYRENETQTYDDGVLHIGNIPIYSTLMSLLSANEIEIILKENNISCKVEDSFIISAYGMPLTSYVITNEGVYFVTVDELLDDIVNKISPNTYKLHLYTPEEYSKKFLPTQGRIILSGKSNVVKSNCIIHHDLVELPLLSVVEGLGGQTEKETDNLIVIYISDHKFLLNTSEGTLTKEGNTTDYFFPAPGTSKIYRYENQEVYIDDITISTFAKEIGIKIDIDRINRELTISQ